MTGINDTLKKCLHCEFEAPVEEWKIMANGKPKILCAACTIKSCTRCSFKAPMKTWELNPNGETYKFCEKCRLWYRNQYKDKTDEIRQADNERNNKWKREKYANDEAYRNTQIENVKLVRCVMVRCPDCNKEMQPTSLRVHLKYKSCKGKPSA